MDEKSKSVYLRCARVYMSTKSWEKAITEYEMLNKEFPNDPFILEPLAKAYFETEQKFKSKEYYMKVKAIYETRGETDKTARVLADVMKYFGAV